MGAEMVIRQKTEQLEKLQSSLGMPDLVKEKVIKVELNSLLEQEDIKWGQRAKVEWLKNGDKNTKFFHACANQRKRRNTIEKIVDGDGRTCSTQREIEGAFISHFQTILITSSPRNIEECMAGMENRVTRSMNDMLLAEFSSSEVKSAFDQMDPMKALGPDGFKAEFYQRNWETVGPKVCAAILKFFHYAKMEESVNSTNIVLIPKSNHPVIVSEFRPISLCTFFIN